MKLPIVEENSIPALDLPGRRLRWLMTQENVGAQQNTVAHRYGYVSLGDLDWALSANLPNRKSA